MSARKPDNIKIVTMICLVCILAYKDGNTPRYYTVASSLYDIQPLSSSRRAKPQLIFLSVTPFTPKSDQFQVSPAASPEILHHTIWRTWLFIQNITAWNRLWSSCESCEIKSLPFWSQSCPLHSDERLYPPFSLHHSYITLYKVGRVYFLSLTGKGLVQPDIYILIVGLEMGSTVCSDGDNANLVITKCQGSQDLQGMESIPIRTFSLSKSHSNSDTQGSFNQTRHKIAIQYNWHNLILVGFTFLGKQNIPFSLYSSWLPSASIRPFTTWEEKVCKMKYSISRPIIIFTILYHVLVHFHNAP